MSKREGNLLYEDLTYQARGAIFSVWNKLGHGFKEVAYQRALAIELTKKGIEFVKEPQLPIMYEGHRVGTYRPDFVLEDKVVVEIKALPLVGRIEHQQLWYYLKGTRYRVALLVNFGGFNVTIKRYVYDSTRPPG